MHLDLPNLAPEPESSVAQWEAKVAEVTQRLQSAPDDPPGYAVRGNYYVYLKRFERAIADCSHALRLKPGMQSARFLARPCIPRTGELFRSDQRFRGVAADQTR